jgi:hypothetical protein
VSEEGSKMDSTLKLIIQQFTELRYDISTSQDKLKSNITKVSASQEKMETNIYLNNKMT